MNKTKIVFGIGMVLAVLAVFAAPAMGYGWETHFVPVDSTGEYGQSDIFVYFNLTESVGETVSWQTDVYYNKNCLEVVEVDQSMSPFLIDKHNWFNDSYHGSNWYPELSPTKTCVHIQGNNVGDPIDAGDYTLAVLRFHCNCTGGSNLLHGYTEANDYEGYPITNGFKYYNGTYTCTGPEETFNEQLLAGWNLISLPLTATDMTVSNVMTSLTYDELQKYNATEHKYVVMESTDTLETGVGYFINITIPSGDTWTYSGSAYTFMNEDLSEGLNMVGWLNCSKDIVSGGALSSIDGNYFSAWRWDATIQDYEVYNPTGDINHFTMMERGEGYFISADAGCPALTKNCE